MNHLNVRPFESDSELDAYANIAAWAFGDTPQGLSIWLRMSPPEHVRVAARGPEVLGGLLVIPMGQYFGGESVPSLGIAGVAVAPEARGGGVARELMRATLADARTRGVAISSLYPATVTLYRKLGYEVAGVRCRWTLRIEDVPRSRARLGVRAVTEADAKGVEATYRAVARERPGYLDRGPYVWNRVRDSKERPPRGVLVESSSGIEGYVYMTQSRSGGGQLDLSLNDLVATTPAGLEALLGVLADHRSTADDVVWYGGAQDARLLAFAEHRFKVSVNKYWMTRLVHVEAALLCRGYPDVTANVDLEVSDDVLPENSGRYVLRVHDRHATVERLAGEGASRIDVRALAALYTGFLSPVELARAGLLQAEPAALQTLTTLFAGPAPAMPDFF